MDRRWIVWQYMNIYRLINILTNKCKEYYFCWEDFVWVNGYKVFLLPLTII